MSSDPWSELAAPEDASLITARRVSVSGKWDFFWGRDFEGRMLLILRHSQLDSAPIRFPSLRGIQISYRPSSASEKSALVLGLLDPSLRDIFFRLCVDIIEAASRALIEPEAVAVALARTWRWHFLLRGGGNTALSEPQQRGFMAELAVLEELLLPTTSISSVLSTWRGPIGGAQDFVKGKVGIEVKSQMATDAKKVRINSEHQLDDIPFEFLFLIVKCYERARAADSGESLTQAVCRLEQRFQEAGEKPRSQYMELVSAAGFRYEDDYTDSRWLLSGQRFLRIAGAFPRLVPSNVSNGVSNVQYDVSLAGTQGFDAPVEMIVFALGEAVV